MPLGTRQDRGREHGAVHERETAPLIQIIYYVDSVQLESDSAALLPSKVEFDLEDQGRLLARAWAWVLVVVLCSVRFGDSGDGSVDDDDGGGGDCRWRGVFTVGTIVFKVVG